MEGNHIVSSTRTAIGRESLLVESGQDYVSVSLSENEKIITAFKYVLHNLKLLK
jgi:hypothetical protein